MFTAVAPTVKTGPEDREVLIGQNVSFSCSVSGNPPPIVRWYHHEALVTNGSMRLHVDDDQTLLTVVGAKPEDAGLVTCQAENIVTDVTRKITLTAQSSAVLTVLGKIRKPGCENALKKSISSVALCSTT